MCGAVLWDRTTVLKENDLIEVLAGHVVAQGLAATVELTDLQGRPSTGRPLRMPGEFDLRIRQADLAAVGEVVSTQDGQYRKQRERATYIRATSFTPCSDLKRSWLVFLQPSAKPDKVMKEVGHILADLERLGVSRAEGCNSPIMISTPLRALNIRSCVSLAVGSGGFRLQCPSTGGFGHSGEAVLRACEAFMSSQVGQRKLSKLKGWGDTDRHLVIVVTPQDLPHIAWALQDPAILPDRSPSAADVLTGLWVVPMFRQPRAIGWRHRVGWSSLTINDWTPEGWDWN